MNGILKDIFLSQLKYKHIDSDEKAVLKEKYILVELENTRYCINMFNVSEILRSAKVVKIPLTPDYVNGIFHLRGDIITNISLQKILDLKESGYGVSSRIIICQHEGISVSFTVHSVLGSISTGFELDTNLEGSEMIKKVLKIGNENPIPIIDIEKIVKIGEVKNDTK